MLYPSMLPGNRQGWISVLDFQIESNCAETLATLFGSYGTLYRIA